MTTTEAAALAGITRQGIQAAIRRKLLPAMKVGRDWQIAPEDFKEWLASPRQVGHPRKEK